MAQLPLHIAATLARFAVGLVLGCACGFLVGTLTGSCPLVRRIFALPVALLMPIPGIAWAPLLMLWLGFGTPTVSVCGALAAFFPLLVCTEASLLRISPEVLEAARLDGAGRLATFWFVRLPIALPLVASGLRLSALRCWRVVVAVELVAAASAGLGYMILDAAEYLRFDIVALGVAVVAGLFFTVESIVPWPEVAA